MGPTSSLVRVRVLVRDSLPRCVFSERRCPGPRTTELTATHVPTLLTPTRLKTLQDDGVFSNPSTPLGPSSLLDSTYPMSTPVRPTLHALLTYSRGPGPAQLGTPLDPISRPVAGARRFGDVARGSVCNNGTRKSHHVWCNGRGAPNVISGPRCAGNRRRGAGTAARSILLDRRVDTRRCPGLALGANPSGLHHQAGSKHMLWFLRVGTPAGSSSCRFHTR